MLGSVIEGALLPMSDDYGRDGAANHVQGAGRAVIPECVGSISGSTTGNSATAARSAPPRSSVRGVNGRPIKGGFRP